MSNMKEMVNKVAKNTGLSRQDALSSMTETIKVIRSMIESEEKVSVPSLGIFVKRPSDKDENRFIFRLK